MPKREWYSRVDTRRETKGDDDKNIREAVEGKLWSDILATSVNVSYR